MPDVFISYARVDRDTARRDEIERQQRMVEGVERAMRRQERLLHETVLNTLTAIFSHPTSHNIRWADTISLLEHVGEVEERHDGKFKITVGPETEIFERPQSKDIGTQMVVDLRRMLRNAGFDPKKPGEEV